MKWVKLGKIFSIDRKINEWCVSHTSAPFPELLEDGIIRIYFSCRNEYNCSSIAFIEYDLQNKKCLSETPTLILKYGEAGLFDDCGCFMGSILVKDNNEKFLYYQGWNLTKVAPQGNFIGLAIFDKNLCQYVKYSKVPIIDRTDSDPFSLSMPIVINDGGLYRMWFGSNMAWKGKQLLNIHIRTAESKDGINWKIYPYSCIIPRNSDEYSFAVSTVLKENDVYKMFYSYRGDYYNIGYAESLDGYIWRRMDDSIDIPVSRYGWDSQMVEFPSVFDYENTRYMLYCGNGYGKSGIGLAKMIKG